MRPLDVSLYLFVLNCNECFRKVVDMWREMDKRNYLTLCISAFKSKLLKISRLIPPRRVLYRAELHPELRMQK